MKTLIVVGVPSGVADHRRRAGLVALQRLGDGAVRDRGDGRQHLHDALHGAELHAGVRHLDGGDGAGGPLHRRGQPDVAVQRPNLGFALTAVYMVTCGLFFFLGSHLLIRLFTADPQVLRTGAMLLVFAAVYQFFDALYITYNGASARRGRHAVPALATAVLAGASRCSADTPIAHHWPRFGRRGPGLRRPFMASSSAFLFMPGFVAADGAASAWRATPQPIE